jgi:hypothetical protein
MNNTFDFNRFSLLVKRQWVENKKLFLMGSFALLGLGIVGYPLSTNWDAGHISEAIQVLFFMGGLFFVGTLFTNYIFKDFSDKNNTTHFLMTPSSHLEKLLSGCFYCFVLFPIVFLAIYFAVDYFFVSFVNSMGHEMIAKNQINGTSWKENVLWYVQLSEKGNKFLQPLIGMWLMAQSATIIGTIMFTRWSYIKTAFIIFASIIILGFLTNYIFDFMIGALDEQPTAKTHNFYLLIKPTKDMLGDITIMCLKYVFTPILLLIAYFKLKEKQV